MATTVNQGPVGSSFYEATKRAKNLRSLPGSNPEAAYYFFDFTSTSIATTSLDDVNDECFVATFPKGARLESLRITSTDMDTGGVPTLELDVIAEDSAGTETILINSNGVTTFEAGGSDELDANISAASREVGGKKLGLKVRSAAATAAAGTVRFSGAIWVGAGVKP